MLYCRAPGGELPKPMSAGLIAMTRPSREKWASIARIVGAGSRAWRLQSRPINAAADIRRTRIVNGAGRTNDVIRRTYVKYRGSRTAGYAWGRHALASRPAMAGGAQWGRRTKK